LGKYFKFLFILFILSCLVLLLSCNFSDGTPNEDLTTDTWSTELENHDEKIQFLKEYVECPSEVLDAEYHIIFQDNSKGFVPGPSYWTVSAAIKINNSDIDEWTSDMEEVSKEQIDTNWWSNLNITDWNISDWNINDWILNDSTACYKRPNESSYLVVYDEQGILLKYFYTN